jgi:hypothetical protein
MWERMPFGKYRGERIEDVPQSYLRWVATLRDLPTWLRLRITQVLADAGGRGDDDARHRQHAPPPVRWPAVLTAWYRWASLKYHPDRLSGDQLPMTVLNDAYDKLKELVEAE